MNIKELNTKRIKLWLDEVDYLNHKYDKIFTEGKFAINSCSKLRIIYQNQYISLIFYYVPSRYTGDDFMSFGGIQVKSPKGLFNLNDLLKLVAPDINIKTYLEDNRVNHQMTYALLIEKYLLKAFVNGDFFWEDKIEPIPLSIRKLNGSLYI